MEPIIAWKAGLGRVRMPAALQQRAVARFVPVNRRKDGPTPPDLPYFTIMDRVLKSVMIMSIRENAENFSSSILYTGSTIDAQTGGLTGTDNLGAIWLENYVLEIPVS